MRVDFVDPGFIDVQLAKRLGDLDRVAAGAEIGRRALQHGDMRAILRHRRDQGRRGRAGADHDDLLVGVIEIVGPLLRMHDAALETVHRRPLRRIAFGVPVVALAHPEEVRGEAQRLAGVGSDGLDGPEVFLARPPRRDDPVLVADVAAEIVFLDHVAHIFQNLGRAGDRCAGPRLEPVAEGVQVAVGADAGIAVGAPGATEAGPGFPARRNSCPDIAWPDDRPRRRRDTGAGDHDVEMLGPAGSRGADLVSDVHRPDPWCDGAARKYRTVRTAANPAVPG